MGKREEQKRRDDFGKFVRTAADRWLRNHRDAGVREFLAHINISSATFYRWRDGTWKEDPSRTKVEMFCTKLGINPQIAFHALAWAPRPEASQVSPEPQVLANDEDADMEAFFRKLRDPRTPAIERAQMREMLRYYATRKPLDPPAS